MQSLWYILIARRFRALVDRYPSLGRGAERFMFWGLVVGVVVASGGAILGYALQ
jgi:hypothetical protein